MKNDCKKDCKNPELDRLRTVQRSKIAVLITLAKIIEKHDNFWIFPSYETIREKLDKIHGIRITRRQLSRHLADLRARGYVVSYKRTHRNPDGTLTLKTSSYAITMKACSTLHQLGYSWALRHLKRLQGKYFSGAKSGFGAAKKIRSELAAEFGENVLLEASKASS